MNTSVSSSPSCDVAVFRRGERTNSLPSTHIPREQAKWMVDCGAARWVNNRYKSILLLVEPEKAKLHDLSSVMGPSVTFLNAAGSRYHAALVEAWQPTPIGATPSNAGTHGHPAGTALQTLPAGD